MRRRLIRCLLTFCIAMAPALADANVSVNQAAGTVSIANPHVAATFSTIKPFDILSLTYGGRQMVAPGENRTPWTLSYLGGRGETPEIDPTCADFQGCTVEKADTAATLVFSWRTRLDYSGRPYVVEMRIGLTDNSPLLTWDLSATVPDSWLISEFKFPRINYLAPERAKLIMPGGWGNEYALRPDTVYKANYPSWTGSMQMTMVDDGRGAIYHAHHDRKASGKLMTIEQRNKNLEFNTHTVASHGWTRDNRFDVPWTTVTGLHPQGWQRAATDWYRPFALTCPWGKTPVTERKLPDWLVDKDLWLRAKYLGDTTVVAVNHAIDYFGEGITFHWYFWHHHSYDSHYPDYFPADPRFAPLVAQVRARNCEVVPYINGRLWDPATESYVERQGHLASCRAKDGSLYTEIYPTSIVPNTVTCPSSPIWKGVIYDLCDRIQDELGTNGIYIDQIAAAAPYPCYAENHPHAKGGGEFWYEAYSDMVDHIHSDHLRPGNIVFSEENAECYIPGFDILLTVNTPHSPSCKIVPLFPLIYSDRTLTCAYTYTPYTDVRLGDFRYQNMQCLLYGSQLGWVDPRLLWVDDKSEYEAQFLRRLVEFRKDQHDVFYGGRYLGEFVPEGDNPYATVPVFGGDYMIKGSEWLSTAGQRVMYVVNSDSQPHTVTLPTGLEVTLDPISAYRYNLD